MMFNTSVERFPYHLHILQFSICQISQRYTSNFQTDLIYVTPHAMIQCKYNEKIVTRLWRLIFQNSVKKHKPHKITDATLGCNFTT